MAIRYEFGVEGRRLVVTASGFDDDVEDVQAYGLAIIEEIRRGGFTSALCDETRLDYRLGTFDTFQAAEFVAERAPKLRKIAIVCREKFIPDAKFWETVVVNRGLRARVFPRIEEARRWLDEPSA